MKPGRAPRGPQPAIPTELWPDLQRMERAGLSHLDIAAWLAERDIKASAPTICRCLAKIRTSASPLADRTVPELDPANDDDEAKLIRKVMRSSLMRPGELGESWKEQHSAAKFLWAANAKNRSAGNQPDHPTVPGFSMPTFGAKPVENN